MNRFFKDSPSKLRHHRLLEVVAMSAAAMLLVAAAVFISEGGMSRLNHVLAMYGITAESQTGCIFPCNNTAYSMQALIPMQGGVPVSSVLPGTSVDWIWNAGEYYGNTFYAICAGRAVGYTRDCGVTINTPDTARLSQQQCTYGYYGEAPCTGYETQCDKQGYCVQTCNAWGPQPYYPSTGCGNADINLGGTTYGSGGGYPPNYAYPGYSGNTPGTLVMTAPATPGTYTYYLCSAWLIWYTSHGNVGCFGTTLTVAYPPPTCSISPTSQSINQTQSSSWTYSTTNATGITYKVDGGTATTPAGNPFSVPGSGLSVGSHSVIMTVTGSGGSATCGTSGNLTVTAAPAPSCTLTPIVSTNTTGNYSYATFSYTTTNAVSATYKVDGGTAITPGNNPFNVTGLSAGSHSVIMTVTNSVGATATCGSANNVTTSALAAPTVAITAGGASSVTVPVNGTTTLAWSTSGEAPAGAGVTAPSSSGTATNFAAITSATANSYYGADYAIGNGYVYQMGGNNGTSYTAGLLRAPLSSDLTNSANWVNTGTTLPATFVGFSKPVILNDTLYLFGGLKSDGSAWTNNICSVPLASIATAASWNCAAGTMAGAYVLSDVAIIGDYLYRFGGYTPGVGSMSSVQRAPVSSPLSWTNFPSVLPQSMYGLGVAIVGNYVYLFGGYNTTNAAQSTIYRALITSDLTVPSNWASAGALPAATYQPGVAVDTTYLYLMGGYSSAGTSMNTIQRTSLANLATGAPSWTNIASLPTSEWYVQPLVVDDKLYIMGGYSNTPTVSAVNKIFAVPFNNGLAYTSPAMSSWLNDGGTNYAVTWPLTVTSVTYTLSATNVVGTSNAAATVNKPDLCTNALYTDIQNPLPSGVSAVGTTCSCDNGNTWSGSSCSLTPPTVSGLSISTLLPGTLTVVQRIKRGNQVKLDWNVAGLSVGDPDTSCSVSSTPASAMTTVTWDKTTTTWSEGSTPPVTITGRTTFTLSCSNATWYPSTTSTSATVNLVPTYQEQ